MGRAARGFIVLGIIGFVAGVVLRIMVGGGMVYIGFTHIKPITVLLFSNSLIIVGLGLDKLTTKA